jgi:hypothetical protein
VNVTGELRAARCGPGVECHHAEAEQTGIAGLLGSGTGMANRALAAAKLPAAVRRLVVAPEEREGGGTAALVDRQSRTASVRRAAGPAWIR